MVLANPLASGHGNHEGLVESWGMAELHVLQGGREAQSGVLQAQARA
jgi:hypothetical protein